MAANCHRDVTAAEVAEAAGISKRRLQAVFKRDYGRSPLRLMADMRLHRVHLALTGRAPAPASLAEAAAQAGHSRFTRFRAAYHARYGRNPALPGQPAVPAQFSTAEKHPSDQPG
jgi:transcriptional regulator GlxA family with amidase domain